MDTTTENTETTNVNKNNDFPSNVLNIKKFPGYVMETVAEHFYTTFKYSISTTTDIRGRGATQTVMDYMVAKLIQPYYPESVTELEPTESGGWEKLQVKYFTITGSSFIVPLKKYIRGLYAFINIAETNGVSWNFVQRTYTFTFVGRGHDRFANKFNTVFWEFIRGDRYRHDAEITITSITNTGTNIFYDAYRSMDSVIMDHAVKDSVISILTKFKNNRTKSFYDRIGEPWHYNMLFYGMPGTGKTSFATALCGVLKIPMIKIDASYLSNYGTKTECEYKSLLQIANEFSNCLILIDEIDLYTYNREITEIKDESAQKRVLLSALLEFLDRISSGHIVIMCTNHIGRLDPALIRNGRVNKKIEFGLWTHEQLLEKLNQSHITYEEFIQYHQEHYADLKYYIDEKPKDGKEYYPSVVSDICKEISLHKFWNQSEN